MSISAEPTERSKPQEPAKRERTEIDQWYRAIPDAEDGPRPIFDEFVRPPRRTSEAKDKTPPGDKRQ
jgi:hypothetical protein